MADADALGNARQACGLIAAAKLNYKNVMLTNSARLHNDKTRFLNHCIVITAIIIMHRDSLSAFYIYAVSRSFVVLIYR